MLISAGVNKFEKARVRHVVPVDRERWHALSARREFVVPSKHDRVGADAERRASAGHVDPLHGWRSAVYPRRIAIGPALQCERKLVPHVEQRFLMHRLVLDDGVHGGGAVEKRIAGAIEILTRE